MTNLEVIHCHPHSHIGETLTVNYLWHNLSSGGPFYFRTRWDAQSLG